MNLTLTYKKIKKYINLLVVSPQELAEKLTAKGLETELINEEIFKFIPLSNRTDLSSEQGLLREITVLLNYSITWPQQSERKKKMQVVIIEKEFIEKKIGLKLTNEEVEKIWKRLFFVYQKLNEKYVVSIPNYRIDITIPEDLVEEIARIYDYNKIPSKLPFLKTTFSVNSQIYQLRNLIRSQLINAGYQEIITYSLISEKQKRIFSDNYKKGEVFRLLNPKNDYYLYYRQSLIASHLQTIQYNLNHGNQNLFFFEISSIYKQTEQEPSKEEYLILSSKGNIFDSSIHNLKQEVDFYWLKGILEKLFTSLNLEKEVDFIFSQINHFHPFQQAEMFFNKEKIGFLGQFYYGEEKSFLAQFSLTKLFTLIKNRPKPVYNPISNFPIAWQDLTLLLEENVDLIKTIDKIKKNGGRFLQEVKIINVYESNILLKERKKSISFRLIFQSQERTLTNKEIEEIVKTITSQFYLNLSKK